MYGLKKLILSNSKLLYLKRKENKEMKREVLEKVMKQSYVDARETAKVETKNGNEKEYSTRMLQALRDMASCDVYPDNRFSDDEVYVWEMFRSMRIKS